MSKVKSTLSDLRHKISNRKHEVSDKLSNGRHGDQERGGFEQDIARLIEEAEGAFSSEDEEANANQRQLAKNLDEFLDNDDPPELKGHYGKLHVMQSQEDAVDSWENAEWISLRNVTPDLVEKEIVFRARVHVVRNMSARLAFIIFREQTTTVQGVLSVKEGEISENMVRWAQHIRAGSIVIVKGKVKKPEQIVQTTSEHHAELEIEKMHLVSARTEPIPFSVYEATSNGHFIADRERLANRILDLRTPASQAIFRVQSAVCRTFRMFLDERDFLEIHTPKLQGGATEGGADVFKLNYFDRPAFLAQSPQLAKQMCISADFARVYEIGPVFRAGN